MWADLLLSQGHELGELISTSLRIEALQQSGAEPHALADLQVRREALDAAQRAALAPWWSPANPELDQIWHHGVLASLRVIVPDPLDRKGARVLLDGLAGALSHPSARFLRQLRVDAHMLNWRPLLAEVLEVLTGPGISARPWTLMLGAPPIDQRRHTTLTRMRLDSEPCLVATQPDRELRNLYVHGVRIDLPWAAGDKGTRLQAIATLPCSPNADLTRFARALWDPSLRVRLQLIDRVPLLGELAAAFVPDLLLVERGEFEWQTRVREVLAHIAQNDAVVRALAQNFTIDQPRCAAWLAASELAAADIAGPRLAAMVGEQRTLRSAVRRELRAAAAKLGQRQANREFARVLDHRTPGSQPLLKRLRRWMVRGAAS